MRINRCIKFFKMKGSGKMKRCLTCLSVFSLFVLLTGVSTSVLAQPYGPGPGGFTGFGPGGGMVGDGSRFINKLNRALVAAGAAELTAGEEEAIVALLREHRGNRPVPDRENPEVSAFAEYAAAVIHDGDVEYWAGEIARAMAARTQAHLLARAELQIGLLEILGEERKSALVSQFGEQGVLRLLGERRRMGRSKMAGGDSEGFSRQRMRVAPRGEVTGP
jgi:hypothetical protein